MTVTITRTYASEEALKNVREDLIATGFEQEHIYIDRDNRQVKVIVPASAEPEVLEILGRHDPVD